ncbi:hypothetical protein DL98DRAFT_517055 [Cadophora sp. DSE1049]|nr:hypothetical protein DL98DRAFT_517055 [Cadophora sp. DSE1049]
MADDRDWILSALEECQVLQDQLDRTEAKLVEVANGWVQTLQDDIIHKLQSMSDALDRLNTPELLQKHLAAASSMTKEEREPLMKYFRGILNTRKRFRHPPSAKNGVNKSIEAGFTPFPDLPLEIRRLIWSHSLPGARIFEIAQGSVNSLVRINDARLAQKSVVKVALSCKEAYFCVLERYEKVQLRHLGYSCPVCILSKNRGNQFYFVDWEQDIFYEPGGNMNTFFGPSRKHPFENNNTDLFKVKNVALHVPSVSMSESTADFISSNMPKIKRIIYVADCERRLEAPVIELKESQGDWYPMRLGEPGHPDADPLPLIRTSVADEDDHPYREIMEEEFWGMTELFRTVTVQEAYKGIHVCIEIWRRAAKE